MILKYGSSLSKTKRSISVVQGINSAVFRSTVMPYTSFKNGLPLPTSDRKFSPTHFSSFGLPRQSVWERVRGRKTCGKNIFFRSDHFPQYWRRFHSAYRLAHPYATGLSGMYTLYGRSSFSYLVASSTLAPTLHTNAHAKISLNSVPMLGWVGSNPWEGSSMQPRRFSSDCAKL